MQQMEENDVSRLAVSDKNRALHKRAKSSVTAKLSYSIFTFIPICKHSFTADNG